MKYPAVLLTALLALAACAVVSPREQVRARLLEAGVKPHMADCLSEKLARKLSIAQLKELGRAARLPGKDVGHMSIDELVYRLRATQDPRIVEVVTRAGIGCAIAG